MYSHVWYAAVDNDDARLQESTRAVVLFTFLSLMVPFQDGCPNSEA
jgi:hypothetical protein